MYKFMFVCTKENAKSKHVQLTDFEPKTSSIISRCLNHYASSVVQIQDIVIAYIYCCTWRLVTNLWRWTSRPTRPRHDVAGLSLNVDLFIAEVSSEAGLGLGVPGADVAAHCGPMEP
jgi:hypothetical protein